MFKNLNKLKKFNQDNILYNLKGLNFEEKEKFIRQLEFIDIKLLHELYIKSYRDIELNSKKISNLKIIISADKNEEEIYIKTGNNIVSNNQYGIVIMAGGNASRLGMNSPKCLLELCVSGKKISLFEIYINKLKEVYLVNNVYLNLYIMINSNNEELIKTFFIKNNYFDYPKDKIKFFVQQELPLLSTKGEILLKNKKEIWLVPNGNGNVFKALKNSGLIKDMQRNHLKYCLFIGIDNVFANLCDFKFIGSTIRNKYKLASKTIFKSNAEELEWVFCKYKNRPYMLDERYQKYFTNKKDSNNNYCYREKNIIYHLIHFDYIKKFSNINLKYHRAYKEYECFNKLGKFEKTKCFKFEQFIYDAFYYADDMLLYRTNEKEFCPIKTKEDIVKVEKKLNGK